MAHLGFISHFTQSDSTLFVILPKQLAYLASSSMPFGAMARWILICFLCSWAFITPFLLVGFLELSTSL